MARRPSLTANQEKAAQDLADHLMACISELPAEEQDERIRAFGRVATASSARRAKSAKPLRRLPSRRAARARG